VKHMRGKLRAGAYISSYSDPVRQKMQVRADVAEEILGLADGVFSKDEMKRLSAVLSDLILGPIYSEKYKSHLPDEIKEYPILGRQQIRRRKSREYLCGNFYVE